MSTRCQSAHGCVPPGHGGRLQQSVWAQLASVSNEGFGLLRQVPKFDGRLRNTYAAVGRDSASSTVKVLLFQAFDVLDIRAGVSSDTSVRLESIVNLAAQLRNS
jgi:hypothetical protein